MMTDKLLMIRPVAFGYNAQTAVNNTFQQQQEQQGVQQKALEEFDAFVTLLRFIGVEVTVIDDTAEPHTPDSIFPNNWISFHEGRKAVLYPMFAENRRAERKHTVLERLSTEHQIAVMHDLSDAEQQNRFLEGTGSMVLDRDARICYVLISERSHPELVEEWCRKHAYKSCTFHGLDALGQPIYHTNVVMCVAEKQVIICLSCIPDANEKKRVMETIEKSGKEPVEISMEQMNHFAGNMLQVQGRSGPLLIMSSQAWKSLHQEQADILSRHSEIVHSPLYTIETNGGGSARCMMAEIYL